MILNFVNEIQSMLLLRTDIARYKTYNNRANYSAHKLIDYVLLDVFDIFIFE